VNCRGNHAANYHLCEVRKEEIRKKQHVNPTGNGTSYAAVAAMPAPKTASNPLNPSLEITQLLTTMAEALLILVNKGLSRESIDSDTANEAVATSAKKFLGTNINGSSLKSLHRANPTAPVPMDTIGSPPECNIFKVLHQCRFLHHLSLVLPAFTESTFQAHSFTPLTCQD
jgi:hypothetical protein